MNISVMDSFDLPDWVGTEPVAWHTVGALSAGAHIEGTLTAAGRSQCFDLLAVDAAYPVPVCPEPERRAAHQAWQFGEVILLEIDGRVAAGVPGNEFDATRACEVLRRVAKSVGAQTSNFTVSITL